MNGGSAPAQKIPRVDEGDRFVVDEEVEKTDGVGEKAQNGGRDQDGLTSAGHRSDY